MTAIFRGRAARLGAGLVLGAVVAAGAAGCGRAGGQSARASGKVTLDGQPLSGAEVELLPKTSPDLGGHSSTTDAGGAFSVRPEAGSNNPLKPGTYVALVRKFRSNGNDPGRPGGGMGAVVDEIPAAYHDRAKSPLVVEIREGDNALPAFDLVTPVQRRR